jgi:hypothetical protein
MARNSTTSYDPGASLRRERMLSMVGCVLGILMFVWGFLRWLKFEPSGSGQAGQTIRKFSGFAFQMPTTAVIGFSLAAGLAALFGATERRNNRGVPSAIPCALAATGFLLAVGIYLGKGAISPDIGDKVGTEVGLVLALITSLLQTIVLGMVLLSRHDDDRDDFVRDDADMRRRVS